MQGRPSLVKIFSHSGGNGIARTTEGAYIIDAGK